MRQLFTAQAWACVHWLLCQQKSGREQLTAFLRSTARTDVPADLEQAAATDPDGALLLAPLGRLRARDKRYRDAVDLFERALASRTITSTERVWVEFSYAGVLLTGAMSERPRAIPRVDLERAETLLGNNELAASGHAEVLALLASAELLLGNHGAAVQHAALAFQAQPRHEFALLLARVWLEAGRGAAARQILEPMVEQGRTADIRQSARHVMAKVPDGAPALKTALPVFHHLAAGEVRFVGRRSAFSVQRRG